MTDDGKPHERPSGCYDAKATSKQLMKTLTVHAQNGPTHDSLPPFRWDQPMPTKPNNMSHAGQPIVFDFDFVAMTPSL